ncbi:hypothetical protein [Burkholderia gladioli]|uniref:hypothetical protein n=1 Tax=Burkholderia gladioli TaxID=28095 RepID=UPI0026569EFC|nr:hypothetical protein [Burkholderia gladioli]MDN7751755.1 hypothetical protein [Burkholderia gladioli]
MNDETKQQQQQQGAAQEAGGAAAGESAAVATAMASSAAYGTQEASKSADVQPVSASSTPSATSAVSAGQVDAPAADYANGLKCSWLGKSTSDMSRDELIAFVGMLDDYATRLAATAQGKGADSQTEQLTAAHPIHAVLGELESEIERPGAILKARVKSLINDARALF